MDKSFKLTTLKTPSSFCKTCAIDFFCKNNVKEMIIKRKCDLALGKHTCLLEGKRSVYLPYCL